MRDWGPNQIDSTRENALQDRERCGGVRHPGVMFGHFPTLPTYVLRDLLLGTT